MIMKKLSVLGGLTPEQFLQKYWQKKPFVIRQAIPAFTPPLSRDELFALAENDDVESRLITCFKDHWQMRPGPHALPSVKKKGWTLLVQGVNLHHEGVDALMQQFRFVPDARLDDVMISYASDTGGVGPHFDSYDVFLLQAQGRRKWRISSQKDLSLIEGMPLKILKNFEAEQEFMLEPGDMLYLPPQYAHDGIAVGECMTYSIGFRAPAFQELGEAFLQFMADSIDLPGRYADPDLAAAKRPAEIAGAMIRQVSSELLKVRFTDADITIFLGQYLTEPKANTFFDTPSTPLTYAGFCRKAGRVGLVLSRKTRMLYRGRNAFINGDSFAVSSGDKILLSRLADARRLDANDISHASQDVAEALFTWYEDGWLTLNI
jgi:50S ribosomal protein L16 3-hydroxylase